jgi:hypothetical protein
MPRGPAIGLADFAATRRTSSDFADLLGNRQRLTHVPSSAADSAERLSPVEDAFKAIPHLLAGLRID